MPSWQRHPPIRAPPPLTRNSRTHAAFLPFPPPLPSEERLLLPNEGCGNRFLLRASNEHRQTELVRPGARTIDLGDGIKPIPVLVCRVPRAKKPAPQPHHRPIITR